MPLINLHTTCIMRGSKETYCFPLFHAGITIGDLFIFCFRFIVKTEVRILTCGSFYASLCKNIRLPYMDEVYYIRYYVCRDRIVVSTLRCGRNNPGSNPGFGKYLILYSVMPLINLHKSRIMRRAGR